MKKLSILAIIAMVALAQNVLAQGALGPIPKKMDYRDA